MARIQLENRLGVTLQRLLFTGRSYTVEPPQMIPPNAEVFWQTDDSGTVSYNALPPGGFVAASAATFPSAPTTAPQPAVTSEAGVANPQPSGEQTAVLWSTAPVAVFTLPPSATAPSVPVAAPSTARQLTLAWDFPTSGRPRFSTRQVDPSLRVRLIERSDGAAYTVSPRRRSKRAPMGTPRPRRLVTALSLVAALLILSTASVSALAVRIGPGHLPLIGALFQHTSKAHTSTVPAATLVLTASNSGVTVGVPVVLTASVEGTIEGNGYGIDIVNVARSTPLTATPCTPVTSPCKVDAVSAKPASQIFRAYVERSYHTGILLTSATITIAWLPINSPHRITLWASPTPDSMRTVHVGVRTPVLLTAAADHSVSNTGYQISIVDSSRNTTPLLGSPCRTGSTCSVQVNSSSPTTISYIAYIETPSQSVRLPSSPITVIWSSTAPPPPPPPTPPTIGLLSSPAANSSGVVQVVINTKVSLTSITSNPVDGSGFESIIQDTSSNRVGGPCASGITCGASVNSSSPTSVTYTGNVVQMSSGQVVKSSNAITVVWSRPAAPCCVTLSVDNANPIEGQTVTLTATTPTPVDNTGYEIQIVDLTDGVVEVTHCATGTRCTAGVVRSSQTSIQYESYVDQGNPYVWVATSPALTVTWTLPPPPTTIQFTTNPAPNCVGSPPETLVDDSTWVYLIATTDKPVDNTGYEFDIVAEPLNNGGVPFNGTQTSGNQMSWPVLEPDHAFNITAYIARISDSSVLLTSSTIEVNWGGAQCSPSIAGRLGANGVTQVATAEIDFPVGSAVALAGRRDECGGCCRLGSTCVASRDVGEPVRSRRPWRKERPHIARFQRVTVDVVRAAWYDRGDTDRHRAGRVARVRRQHQTATG